MMDDVRTARREAADKLAAEPFDRAALDTAIANVAEKENGAAPVRRGGVPQPCGRSETERARSSLPTGGARRASRHAGERRPTRTRTPTPTTRHLRRPRRKNSGVCRNGVSLLPAACCLLPAACCLLPAALAEKRLRFRRSAAVGHAEEVRLRGTRQYGHGAPGRMRIFDFDQRGAVQFQAARGPSTSAATPVRP